MPLPAGLLAGAVVLILLPLLLLALYVPPNNFDSDNYHLHRVMAWYLQGHVGPFPTLHVQQLYHNVNAEYWQLQLFLLSGSDRPTALVQYGAMLGSLAAVSLTGRCIGLPPRGQLMAALLLLLLPIGLFEATTTQNDYLATFYFTTFVAFLFTYFQADRPVYALLAMVAVVLGGFTKYTVLFYALPFCLLFSIREISKKRWGRLLGLGLFGAVIFVSINFPFLHRNDRFFGSPFGPQPGQPLFTERIPAERFGWRETLSSVLKNSSLHLGLPHTAYNDALLQGLRHVHGWLDVPLQDPAITLTTVLVRHSFQEDSAPNSLHFLLLLVALPLALGQYRNNRLLFWLSAGALVGFVLFCTVFKYQIFSSRTHMPFFAIGCVVTAFMLSRMPVGRFYLVVACMSVPALVAVYGNPQKPLLPLAYFLKKMTNHVPADVCCWHNQAAYAGRLGAYYDFQQPGSCHRALYAFTARQKAQVFSLLDELGYYDDRKRTIFDQDEAEMYFNGHRFAFRPVYALSQHVKPPVTGVGVLFKAPVGFYHTWRLFCLASKATVPMGYVHYPKPYEALQYPAFRYDYLLCDDARLLQQYVPPEAIAARYQCNSLYLIRLRKPQQEVFLY